MKNLFNIRQNWISSSTVLREGKMEQVPMQTHNYHLLSSSQEKISSLQTPPILCGAGMMRR